MGLHCPPDVGQSVSPSRGTETKAVQVAREYDALLARIDDPALRDDLRRSFDKVRAKRTFGLVFESHLPERVTLPSHPIRRGVRVARRDDQRQVFFVGTVKRGIAQLTPIGTDDDSPDDHPTELPVSDLVVVAEFGEPIYPGLKHLESVHRGGDKPAHTVINAENHHALELLQFTHAGKIDCIYIDPPYNTGARDWKYDRTPLVRVEALADIGGTIRALDLLDPAVRTAVRAFDGGDTRGLYASSHGRDYR